MVPAVARGALLSSVRLPSAFSRRFARLSAFASSTSACSSSPEYSLQVPLVVALCVGSNAAQRASPLKVDVLCCELANRRGCRQMASPKRLQRRRRREPKEEMMRRRKKWRGSGEKRDRKEGSEKLDTDGLRESKTSAKTKQKNSREGTTTTPAKHEKASAQTDGAKNDSRK
ncbi:hypothetical protein TGRUB_366240 [Toxoplasma gondii RUB]|uniref:Uncharacterized protein n=1 Tax=Toxoplasma gondii RUB TaxID=935652 RepID=A0A086M181_TOXGO|nr:hypothetical protein TGRUB_366240 [Toxoplasma gondii RUB]